MKESRLCTSAPSRVSPRRKRILEKKTRGRVLRRTRPYNVPFTHPYIECHLGIGQIHGIEHTFRRFDLITLAHVQGTHRATTDLVQNVDLLRSVIGVCGGVICSCTYLLVRPLREAVDKLLGSKDEGFKFKCPRAEILKKIS